MDESNNYGSIYKSTWFGVYSIDEDEAGRLEAKLEDEANVSVGWFSSMIQHIKSIFN